MVRARAVKITRLPRDKDAQVDITVREMIRWTVHDAWHVDVRWLAEHWRLPHYNRLETAESYNANIRAAVEFELDPRDIELVRTPSYYARVIRRRGGARGDCDDTSLLLGTLLFSKGYQLAYVVMATSPMARDFQHVFVATYINGKWHNFDPSVPRPYSTDGLRQKWYRVPYGHGPPPL